jgi:hypothetical protein
MGKAYTICYTQLINSAYCRYMTEATETADISGKAETGSTDTTEILEIQQI